MGRIRQLLGLEESPVTAQALQRATAAEDSLEVVAEGLADLELALEDTGWERLTTQMQQELSRDGLQRAAEVARVMNVANPLIKRGLAVRQSYVWGQGVQIQARATGEDGQQDVNAVVQAFLDDAGNRRAFTGDQAREQLETALGTDGNVFLACFTNPRTGRVQVRTLPFDEITDVITNPGDRNEPWFYRRQWNETVISPAGQMTTVQRVAYYPALGHRPTSRPRRLNGDEVMWDAPVYQVAVNQQSGWNFGIGDAYAALPWARSYRDFLADWATLVKALSQFAWKASSKNGSKAAKLRQSLARRPASPAPAGNENNVGATAVTGPDVTLEAIPKTGATIDSDSGRPLAAMVAAALGIPVTILLSDPGQTGARAVAETLDAPTRNEMNQRRAVWSEAYRAILAHVILAAVKAPAGPLTGTVGRDELGGEIITLAGDTEPTVEIVWPSLDDTPVETIVEAIVKADSTKTLPPLVIVKLLLQALGVDDVDEIIEQVTDDNGDWLDPYATVGNTVAQAAIDAYRRGADPAAAVR